MCLLGAVRPCEACRCIIAGCRMWLRSGVRSTLLNGRGCRMAQGGDSIDNPVTGQRVIFRKRAGDTGGELLQFELFMKPHGPRMLEHVHPRQEELLEVVAGAVRYRLGGAE